jgi:hypothetical protein
VAIDQGWHHECDQECLTTMERYLKEH